MKFLKCSSIIACILASLCLYLMLSTRAVYVITRASDTTYMSYYYGQDVLYVYSTATGYGSVARHEPSGAGLCAFICLNMAVLMLSIAALITFIKNERAFNIVAGVLNATSMLLIFIAAITILFVSKDWSYISYMEWAKDKSRTVGLGGGFVAVSVISFFNTFICLPSVITCFKKDKAIA